MPFYISEVDELSEREEDWPSKRRRLHFLNSKVAEILEREITRYINGEVPGRSFLIAGHRGAGKTALVGRVIENVRRDVFNKSPDQVANDRRNRGTLQRPIFVRVHGPSLFLPQAVEQGTEAP